MLAQKRVIKRKEPPHREGDAMTVAVFCRRNAISISLYYAMKREGKAPREMRIGNKRIVITPEAERDWRREREAETAAEQRAARNDRSVAPPEDSSAIHHGDRSVIQKDNKA